MCFFLGGGGGRRDGDGDGNVREGGDVDVTASRVLITIEVR